MCGIIGILLADQQKNVNQLLYDGLTILQHRGQDAAGIVTLNKGRFHLRKDNGLVKDVFQERHMLNLKGSAGIGHCRYPTAGSSSNIEAQPFYTNSPYGICLAHNGNLTNAAEITVQLSRNNVRHINTDSDSEILLNILAEELMKQPCPLQPANIFDAVTKVHKRCKGGYAAVALINGIGLLAFRDPYGIRPLAYGNRETPKGVNHAFASESVAFDTLDFSLQRDVLNGEAVFITMNGEFHSQICADFGFLSPCIFEHVYLARPDSVLDGVSVYQSRLLMGEKLAEKIRRVRPDHDIDVVIPIPDTSRTSALQSQNRVSTLSPNGEWSLTYHTLSYKLNIPYREGFIKNRYIARTFIMPGQATRKKTVKLKLNPIKSEFKDRVVLLVDDSIVRGTTASQIVQLAREAGAKRVYLASAAPAIRHPNVYGIDMPTRDELVAYRRDEDSVANYIGADWVIYQDLSDLEECVRTLNTSIKQLDTSCFSGCYVTGDITEEYFLKLNSQRSDFALSAKNSGIWRTFSDPAVEDNLDLTQHQ